VKSFADLLMPIFRGRDHLDRRLAWLHPWYTNALLLDVFRPELTDAENVARLRDAAAGAPNGVQQVLPVGPDHAMLLLATVPATVRPAVEYATRLVGDENFVVFQNGEARDRRGVPVVGSTLDADAIDLWAEHLGMKLGAEGMYERTPSFIAYARAMNLT
jgi:hypothetical protein